MDQIRIVLFSSIICILNNSNYSFHLSFDLLGFDWTGWFDYTHENLNKISRVLPVHKFPPLTLSARLAEWSKASDLSSDNRKIAWVRTPHLANTFLSAILNAFTPT